MIYIALPTTLQKSPVHTVALHLYSAKDPPTPERRAKTLRSARITRELDGQHFMASPCSATYMAPMDPLWQQVPLVDPASNKLQFECRYYLKAPAYESG